jgi:hypothetical protein
MAAPSGVVPDTAGIRLRNRGNPSLDINGRVEGRLEVFHYGQWGTVCNNGFDKADAQVACRQLGNELGYTLTDSVVSINYLLGGFDPIWLDDLGCSGSETNLGDCSHNGWGNSDCSHDNDSGVSCTFLAPVEECEECVAGKYSDTMGVAACTDCAAGTSSTVVAAVSADACMQCEAGSASPGGPACEECVAGKFSDTTGVAACSSCAAGTYNTVVGSVSAADCQQVRVDRLRGGEASAKSRWRARREGGAN